MYFVTVHADKDDEVCAFQHTSGVRLLKWFTAPVTWPQPHGRKQIPLPAIRQWLKTATVGATFLVWDSVREKRVFIVACQ